MASYPLHRISPGLSPGILWLMGLVACLVWGSLFGYIPQYISPAEDATILFRYSRQLAAEGVITYNPGGEPVEGATDFLWMLLLAAGIKFGLAPYAFACILSVLGLIGTCWIWLIWIRPLENKPWLPLLLLISLLFNSQIMAAVQGFSVGFFGFWGVCCLYFYWRDKIKALTICALVLSLIRPDGLIVGVPLVLALLYEQRGQWRSNFRMVLLWGLIPGMLYLIWRIWYFGEWLPLPLYVKGAAQGWQSDSIRYEFHYLSKYLFPLLALIIWALWRPHPHKRKLIMLCLAGVGLPLLMYASIRLEQNVADRFMYLIHLSVLSIFFLLWAAHRTWHKGFLMAWLMYIFLSLLYFGVFLKSTLEIAYANPVPVARALAQTPSLRMAVTEAGRLPYYSDWESLDLWGLNTPELATRVVKASDLAVFNPDLILLAFDYRFQELDALLQASPARHKTWAGMVQNSYQYAVHSSRYERWMLPYRRERNLPAAFAWIRQQMQALIAFKQTWIGGVYSPPYPRYHLYLIRKDSPGIAFMRSLLQQKGAITWEAFQAILPTSE